MLAPELTKELISLSEPGFRIPALTNCDGFCAYDPIAATFSLPTFTMSAPFCIADANGPFAALCAVAPTSAAVAELSSALLIWLLIGVDNAVASLTAAAPVLNPAWITEERIELGAIGNCEAAPNSIFKSTPCPACAHGACAGALDVTLLRCLGAAVNPVFSLNKVSVWSINDTGVTFCGFIGVLPVLRFIASPPFI